MNSIDATVAAICTSRTRSELTEAMGAGLAVWGLQCFYLSLNKKGARERIWTPSLTNWDDERLNVYREAKWADRDPLLAGAAEEGFRKLWQASDWNNTPQRAYGALLESWGVKCGGDRFARRLERQLLRPVRDVLR